MMWSLSELTSTVTSSHWWRNHDGSVTSPFDESFCVGDVGVGDIAFADDIQRFYAVLWKSAHDHAIVAGNSALDPQNKLTKCYPRCTAIVITNEGTESTVP